MKPHIFITSYQNSKKQQEPKLPRLLKKIILTFF